MSTNQIIIVFGALNVLMWALMIFYNSARDAYFKDYEKKQRIYIQSACDFICSSFQSLIDNIEAVVDESGENGEDESGQ